MAKLLIAALLTVYVLIDPALAQSDAFLFTQCRISKGDPADKVMTLYGVSGAPERLTGASPAGATFQYHLERYGIWVFFDEHLTVRSLRFDAPFRGRIAGVAIGDDAEQVRRANGAPARLISGLPDAAAVQRRKDSVREILEALPDPSPKRQVLDAFAAIAHLNAEPPVLMSAWVYNLGEPSFMRFDIGASDNKVRTILVNSCSADT